MKSCVDFLDIAILKRFLTFNSSLLKTNFWRKDKAALSFSFKPEFVSTSGYKQDPFCIFFVVGYVEPSIAFIYASLLIPIELNFKASMCDLGISHEEEFV